MSFAMDGAISFKQSSQCLSLKLHSVRNIISYNFTSFYSRKGCLQKLCILDETGKSGNRTSDSGRVALPGNLQSLPAASEQDLYSPIIAFVCTLLSWDQVGEGDA